MVVDFNKVKLEIGKISEQIMKDINHALQNNTEKVITITYSKCERKNENESIILCSDFDTRNIDNTPYYTYLFFNKDNECLYVGKSKDIKTRLRSHLISNNMKNGKYGTSSKIENLYDYLGHECQNEVILKLVLISVEPRDLYGTLEGQLICKYSDMENKQATWNLRED